MDIFFGIILGVLLVAIIAIIVFYKFFKKNPFNL